MACSLSTNTTRPTTIRRQRECNIRRYYDCFVVLPQVPDPAEETITLISVTVYWHSRIDRALVCRIHRALVSRIDPALVFCVGVPSSGPSISYSCQHLAAFSSGR